MRSCPKVLVGILAADQKAKTMACLEALEASQFQDFEAFLVDNGSGEGIGKEASERFPFVQTEILERNIGVAAARNIVVRHFLNSGKWPYLLFLDNDIFVEPETLGTVLRRSEELEGRGIRLGALSAYIVYRDNPEKYWCAGGAMIDWENASFEKTGQGALVGKDFCESRQVDTAPTAFLFVTRKAIEKVQLFVEDYFMYFEDTDWSWRIVRAGFELRSVPEAVVKHDVSSTIGHCSPSFYYHRTRNRLWFFQAFSPKDAGKLRWCILKSVVQHAVYPEFRDGNFKAVFAMIFGFLAGIRVPRNVKAVAAHIGSSRMPATEGV